jgi:hypothetical protein
MFEMNCQQIPGNPCCSVKYCPLVLAWATTVHKFQGFEAGFDEKDQINRIVANIGELDWEKINPGTAYVVTSRARTVGTPTVDNPNPTDSALYFDGPIGIQRFEDVLFKDNGQKTLMVEKRERWVKYLEHHKLKTDEIYNEKKVLSMTENVKEKIRANNHNNTKGDLNLKIITMITNPNKQWKLRRDKYLVRER